MRLNKIDFYSTKNKLIFSFITISVISIIVFILSRIDFNTTSNFNNDINGNIEYADDIILIDFETKKHIATNSYNAIASTNSLSGKNSTFVNNKNDFSATITLGIDELNIENLNDIHINCWYYPVTENIDFCIVVSVFDNNYKNQLYWDCQHITDNNIKPEYWYNTNGLFSIPDSINSPDNKLKIYVLNNLDNSTVYFDDFKIAFSENNTNDQDIRQKTINYENINAKGISSNFGNKSNYSAVASGNDGYSFVYSCKTSEFKINLVNFISYTFYYYSEKENIDFVLVFAFKDENGNTLHWYGHQLGQTDINKKWTKVQGFTSVPPEIFNNKNNTIEVYGWNRNNNTVYIDDVYFILKNTNDAKKGEKVLCYLSSDANFSPKINQPPYPSITLVNKLKNYLRINYKQYKLNVCTKASIISNGYEQVIAGDRYDNLNCYFVDNATLKSIPIKNSIKTSSKAKYVPIDINNDGIDELLIFDNDINILSCLKLKYTENSIETSNLFSINYNEISDFNSPKLIKRIQFSSNSEACIIINENGQVGLIKINNLKPEYINLNQTIEAAQSIIEADIDSINSGNEIIVFSGDENKSNYLILKLTDNNSHYKLSTLSSYVNARSGYDILPSNAKYVYADFGANYKGKILMLDRTWRFDLKQILIKNNFYEILNNINFKGYKNNNNPKYYPTTAIVAGNFYGDCKSEIMIFSLNQNNSILSNNNKNSDFLIPKVEVYEIE